MRALGENGVSEYASINPGRIRYEANQIVDMYPGWPAASTQLGLTEARLWPETDAPTLKVVSLGGYPVPVDPESSFDFPFHDLDLATSQTVTMVLEGWYLPPNAEITVRFTPTVGDHFLVTPRPISDNGDISTWEAQVTIPNGVMAVQARASWAEAP